MSNILGLDIGGANIKACDLNGQSVSLGYPLWKNPEGLSDALLALISQFPDVSNLAVTMTGELADCFATKTEGVRSIVQSVEVAISRHAGLSASYWQTSGEFVDAETAIEFPILTAAANWHLQATWAGRVCPSGLSLLIDMGSTTTDIIPIQDGMPDSVGSNDVERLQSSELLYLGVRRTPLMALGHVIQLNGQPTGTAAELFATTDDLFLFDGDIPEFPDQRDTADGQPRTRHHSHQRLARMACGDASMIDEKQTRDLCRQWKQRMSARLINSFNLVASSKGRPTLIMTSGEGEFFVSEILKSTDMMSQATVLSLSTLLGPKTSEVACAYAAVQIASERPWQFG
jgi:probable H4MPT-linked C1 transfer pathway protein